MSQENLRSLPIFTTSDASKLGVSRMTLSRLVDSGQLEKIQRGLYGWIDRPESELCSFAEVSARVDGVISLLSALRYYNITTQEPFEVWLQIESRKRVPKMEHLNLRVFKVGKSQLSLGVVEVVIDGVRAKVTNVERTVVDCFKFRNKVGLDVAIEVLIEAQRANLINADKLWLYAKELRMANVMMPYLEMAGKLGDL
ncbi:type IV toxin-antitoxin system AbiEi family antitoxin domain-containing protein [Vibrio crassostreae]|uniref:type IV toxin-antitoxin system AbiEi family antitoxin domain-containing protein n=1 Tax=Vibrio crassostreae TaxID=246167 RepID=UPI001B30E6A2|nr:type IV toxin-antitoxin system AbiEi family antitoxin domain-containing protein [Vibrio crassostreae]